MITKIIASTLFVKNFEEAIDFYKKHFNFVVHKDVYFKDCDWVSLNIFDQTNVDLILLKIDSDEFEFLGKIKSKPFLCLQTDDCQGDYERLKKDGVQFLTTIKNYPWGIGVFCEDLYGNVIYLNQPLMF